MKEIEANKKAWNLIAEDHYHSFKKALENNNSLLNDIITKELGDITGKKIIHLQCNTGGDSISLARMGAIVTGIDLAPDNVMYAKKLAKDFHIDNIRFIESDILKLKDIHHEKYDIVFTSEGTVGWMPDIYQWANTVRHLLKDDGFFYIFESHPFFMMLDEGEHAKNRLLIKYPYFDKKPDIDDTIGGYASEPKEATSYFWMYTLSDIINSLSKAGLDIQYFNEFDKLGWNTGGMELVEKQLYQNTFFKEKFPLSFSLQAKVRTNKKV